MIKNFRIYLADRGQRDRKTGEVSFCDSYGGYERAAGEIKTASQNYTALCVSSSALNYDVEVDEVKIRLKARSSCKRAL